MGQRQSFEMGIWRGKGILLKNEVWILWSSNTPDRITTSLILGAEEFSSPWCVVLGGIREEAKWYPQDGHEGSVPSFRPASILRAILKWIKVSFTCLMICLDEETRCQEPVGGDWTVILCRRVLAVSRPPLHPLPGPPSILFPVPISQALLPDC